MTKITEIMAEMAVFEALRHLLWPEQWPFFPRNAARELFCQMWSAYVTEFETPIVDDDLS